MESLRTVFSNDVFLRLENRLNVVSVFSELQTMSHWIKFEELVFESCIGRGSFGVVFAGSWKDLKVAIKLEIVSHELESQVNTLCETYALSLFAGSPYIVQQHGFCIISLSQLMSDEHLVTLLAQSLATPHHITDDLIRYEDTSILDDLMSSEGHVRISVLELCERGALRECLTNNNNNNLSTSVKCRILMDACKGLVELHHRGMLHRDIKTTNILVTSQMRGKLCDFDAVTCPDHDTGLLDYSAGTIEFCSPEMALGQEMLCLKSDVFAIGIILVELLTGKIPGVDVVVRHPRDLFAVNMSQLESDLIACQVPESYINLIKSCCQVDASARPSIDDFILSLQEIVKLDLVSLLIENDPTIDQSFNLTSSSSLTSPDREGTRRHVTKKSDGKHKRCPSLGWNELNDKDDDQVVVDQLDDVKLDDDDDDDDDEFRRCVDLLIASHQETLSLIASHSATTVVQEVEEEVEEEDVKANLDQHHKEEEEDLKEIDIKRMMKKIHQRRGFKAGSSSSLVNNKNNRTKTKSSKTTSSNRFQDIGAFPVTSDQSCGTSQASSKHDSTMTSLSDYVVTNNNKTTRDLNNMNDDSRSLSRYVSSQPSHSTNKTRHVPTSLSAIMQSRPQASCLDATSPVKEHHTSPVIKRDGSEKWKRLLASSNVASLLS